MASYCALLLLKVDRPILNSERIILPPFNSGLALIRISSLMAVVWSSRGDSLGVHLEVPCPNTPRFRPRGIFVRVLSPIDFGAKMGFLLDFLALVLGIRVDFESHLLQVVPSAGSAFLNDDRVQN